MKELVGLSVIVNRELGGDDLFSINTMVKIVAIGGGEIRDKDTLSIDQEILIFSGKKHPKILFLPTASNDSEGYFGIIKKYFENL